MTNPPDLPGAEGSGASGLFNKIFPRKGGKFSKTLCVSILCHSKVLQNDFKLGRMFKVLLLHFVA